MKTSDEEFQAALSRLAEGMVGIEEEEVAEMREALATLEEDA